MWEGWGKCMIRHGCGGQETLGGVGYFFRRVCSGSLIIRIVSKLHSLRNHLPSSVNVHSLRSCLTSSVSFLGWHVSEFALVNFNRHFIWGKMAGKLGFLGFCEFLIALNRCFYFLKHRKQEFNSFGKKDNNIHNRIPPSPIASERCQI